MRSYAAEVTYLLDEGLPVMVYSGLEDLICNSLSQEWCSSAFHLSAFLSMQRSLEILNSF